MAKGPKYFWDTKARQFRDERGRFVRRADVRAALDSFIDRARLDIERVSKRLQKGKIDLTRWQLEMESIVKRVNTASGAIGKGGASQLAKRDLRFIESRIKKQFRYLERFAIEIERGLPLDGRFINRAKLYGESGRSTYEAVLRRDDIDAGFDEERRLLHAARSCEACISYAGRGWVRAGELPDIGAASPCKIRCRCSFERRRKGRKTV